MKWHHSNLRSFTESSRFINHDLVINVVPDSIIFRKKNRFCVPACNPACVPTCVPEQVFKCSKKVFKCSKDEMAPLEFTIVY